MSTRTTGSSLMFDENEVRQTGTALPRLIRVIFYGLGITNEGYLDRYFHYFREQFPDKTRKEFSQKAAADRKFLLDRRKLTFNMMSSVMNAMGYEIEEVSVKIRDRLTGDERVFSTSDTVDSLNEMIAKDQEIGVQSII